MKKNIQTTREHILGIAGAIFFEKGLAGTRMQEIADEAGINKAMLHYYFTSKEQLFETVFADALGAFIGRVAAVLNSKLPLKTKISNYVDDCIDTLRGQPSLPQFVLHELSVRPARASQLFGGKGKVDFSVFRQQVAQQGHEDLDPEMLFTDMVALCVYPFVAQPMLKKLLSKNDKAMDLFFEKRKAWIKAQLLRAL